MIYGNEGAVLLRLLSMVRRVPGLFQICLLYTSDAADERSSVDLGGRRIIKKKNIQNRGRRRITNKKQNARHDRLTN